MESDKYYNDAIYGNEKITASLNRNGKLIRLFYPNPDYMQLVDYFDVVFKINDEYIYNVSNDLTSKYNQYFKEKTNVVVTDIKNENIGLDIEQKDFALIDENVLIRNYEITNTKEEAINIMPILSSKIMTSLANEAGTMVNEDASSLVQYNHEYSLCIFSKEDIFKKKVNNSNLDIENGDFDYSQYIGLSNGSSISYKKKEIAPAETITFTIYIYVNENSSMNVFKDTEFEIVRIKKMNPNDKEKEVTRYWEKFTDKHIKHDISKLPEDMQKIYIRTILLFEILRNSKTGGIPAALEIDEEKTKSGRYSFVWPRDAYYTLKAYNILGFEKYSEKFFDVFLQNTQSRIGRWEQRFYTSGSLAPCWGYQIDETAIVIALAYEQYMFSKNEELLKRNLQMLQNAYKYVLNYVKKVVYENEKTNTFDLWENYEGESTYGLASCYAGLESMKNIYEVMIEELKDNRLRVEQMRREIKEIEPLLVDLKKYIEDNYYNEERQSYVNNVDENKIDISTLALITPFNIFTERENKITNTVANIDMTLKTHTGGYIRYENDYYLGGYHPWTIANLWMSMYNAQCNDWIKAKENLNFVVVTATENGYIAEQINNETMKAEWVIGLLWAHGMYICMLDNIIKNNKLDKEDKE